MRFLMIVCLLLSLIAGACSSDEPNRAHLVDPGDASAAPDALDVAPAPDVHGEDATSEPDAPAPDVRDTYQQQPEITGPPCECDQAGPCCDGCWAINRGEACDDGLHCTMGTTCQPDGECAGATASPCDELLAAPECQQATCDEVAGCSIQNIHEGFACDDGNARTVEDRCVRGQCVGTPCECDEGACCDGCWFLDAGTVCETGDERDWCSAFETCGASRVRQQKQRLCTGQSAGCDAPAEWVTVEVLTECGSDAYCLGDSRGSQCWPSVRQCV